MIGTVNLKRQSPKLAGNDNGNSETRRRKQNQEKSKSQYLVFSSSDSDDIPVVTVNKENEHVLDDISDQSGESSDSRKKAHVKDTNWSVPESDRHRAHRKKEISIKEPESPDEDEDARPKHRRKRRRTPREDEEQPHEEVPEELPEEEKEINVTRKRRKRKTKVVEEEDHSEEEEKPKPKRVKRRKRSSPDLEMRESDIPAPPKTEETAIEELSYSNTKLFEVRRKKRIFGGHCFMLIENDKSILGATSGKIEEGKGYRIFNTKNEKENVGFLRMHQSAHRFTFYEYNDDQKGELFGLMFTKQYEKPNARMVVLVFCNDYLPFSPASKDLNLSRIAMKIDKEDKEHAKKDEKKLKEKEKEEKKKQKELEKEEKRRQKEEEKKAKLRAKGVDVSDSDDKKDKKEESTEDTWKEKKDESSTTDIYAISGEEEEEVEEVNRSNYGIFYSDVPHKDKDGEYTLSFGGADVQESKKNYVIRKRNSNKCLIMCFKLSNDMFRVRYTEPFTKEAAFAFAIASLIAA